MSWFEWLFGIVAAITFTAVFVGALYLILTNRKEKKHEKEKIAL